MRHLPARRIENPAAGIDPAQSLTHYSSCDNQSVTHICIYVRERALTDGSDFDRSSTILKYFKRAFIIRIDINFKKKEILYLIDWRDPIGNFEVQREWRPIRFISVSLYTYFVIKVSSFCIPMKEGKIKKGPLDFFKKFCRIMKRLPAQSFDGRVSIILR